MLLSQNLHLLRLQCYVFYLHSSSFIGIFTYSGRGKDIFDNLSFKALLSSNVLTVSRNNMQMSMTNNGRLGPAMVLGSLQSLWVLLLVKVIVRQGLAMLAASAGRGYFLFLYLIYPIFPFYAPSLGRRLDITELLWPRSLNTNGSCQLIPGTCSLSTG